MKAFPIRHKILLGIQKDFDRLVQQAEYNLTLR